MNEQTCECGLTVAACEALGHPTPQPTEQAVAALAEALSRSIGWSSESPAYGEIAEAQHGHLTASGWSLARTGEVERLRGSRQAAVALAETAMGEAVRLREAVAEALRWFALADRGQNVHRYREGVRILNAALSEPERPKHIPAVWDEG